MQLISWANVLIAVGSFCQGCIANTHVPTQLPGLQLPQLHVNRAPYPDEGGLVGDALGLLHSPADGVHVGIAILDVHGVPVQGVVAGLHILGEGDVGVAVDGDLQPQPLDQRLQWRLSRGMVAATRCGWLLSQDHETPELPGACLWVLTAPI